jgi:hypothetical protein
MKTGQPPLARGPSPNQKHHGNRSTNVLKSQELERTRAVSAVSGHIVRGGDGAGGGVT